MKKILLSTIALVGIVFVLSSESQARYSSSYTKYNQFSDTYTTYGDGYTTTSKYNKFSDSWNHNTYDW